jgi:NTE family protein
VTLSRLGVQSNARLEEFVRARLPVKRFEEMRIPLATVATDLHSIPTAAVRSLGADLVIAVDVNSEGAKFLGPPHSIVGVLVQSMMVVQRTAAIHQLHDADVVVRPRTGHMRWDEWGRTEEFISLGQQAARSTIERIKHLLEPIAEPQPKWYQLRRRPQPQEDKRRVSPLK